ncbi:amidohydrolase [Sphaerimonospora sp. CA-214678]|uniref:amidohydrolase n=1 Tax=Sphaerimonospora sp. CA-214678 TaxID=3240029 RepID=UPI003D8DC1E2
MNSPSEDLKEKAAHRIAANADELVALSHRIHAHPETAFSEQRAARWCAELLQAVGIEVQSGICDMPTAFSATAGTGPFTIALCCEYDALPGLGHACGHNIIAAAGVGAAIGLHDLTAELGIRLKVLGTPAEESGGGKVLLLERGAFADVDIAMMIHPAAIDSAAFRSFARTTIKVEYRGRAAHAAAAPHLGRNAADAMTVAQVAIGLLRQQLPDGCRVHGIAEEAGNAYNIIPSYAAGRFGVRARTVEGMRYVRARVEECLRAGALAAGCEFTISTPEPDYLDFRADDELASLFEANARSLGRNPIRIIPAASTDMGNISQVLPSLHATLAVGPGDAHPHQPAFATHCASDSADRAVLDGATALAWTAIDMARLRLGRLRSADLAGTSTTPVV